MLYYELYICILYICDFGIDISMFSILKIISLTLRDTLKPSVTKTYSVSFNHDAGLPYKKVLQKIKPF